MIESDIFNGTCFGVLTSGDVETPQAVPLLQNLLCQVKTEFDNDFSDLQQRSAHKTKAFCFSLVFKNIFIFL